ncbi:hypothetical protein [Pseudodesulfovibrio cashew]|nr:hypothetical protein [Pseudodesulfovibrio cashew]
MLEFLAEFEDDDAGWVDPGVLTDTMQSGEEDNATAQEGNDEGQ